MFRSSVRLGRRSSHSIAERPRGGLSLWGSFHSEVIRLAYSGRGSSIHRQPSCRRLLPASRLAPAGTGAGAIRHMPRRDRCILPGVPCHVTQRGVDRRETFSCDADRKTYLGLLRRNLGDSGKEIAQPELSGFLPLIVKLCVIGFVGMEKRDSEPVPCYHLRREWLALCESDSKHPTGGVRRLTTANWR